LDDRDDRLESPPPITTPVSPTGREVWGAGVTLLFGFVLLVAHSVVGTVAFFVLYAATPFREPGANAEAAAVALEASGAFLASATIFGVLVQLPLVWLFCALRMGWPTRRYLALKSVGWRVWATWLGIALLSVVAIDGSSHLLGREIVPDFVRSVFSSADNVLFLWIALVVAAPVGEEVLFRGFLFEGLRRSRIGTWGAIVVTSVAWAGLHLQYGLYEIVAIGLLGIVLGLARWKTGSLYVPIGMHAFVNFIASLEATFL